MRMHTRSGTSVPTHKGSPDPTTTTVAATTMSPFRNAKRTVFIRIRCSRSSRCCPEAFHRNDQHLDRRPTERISKFGKSHTT